MSNVSKNTWILHIDGDGFFAYCEIARFPHLKGLPVVVGEDRGIACAMTYEAKKLGITRAMPIFKIRKEFPQVIILSSHFELYEHYARMLSSLLAPVVDVLERYSIDECFGSIERPVSEDKASLLRWLTEIKQRIQTHTGLTYSFGLARTKVLAKIASKYQKPDGCTVIMPEEESEILQQTPIESLWGIGWKMARRFENMRVRTAGEFAAWNEERVQSLFSIPIQELWHELHGRCMFSVSPSSDAPKSLQATRSVTPASNDASFLIAEILHNTDVVFSRMRRYGLTTNAISIFIKTSDREYRSIAIPLEQYTNNPLAITDPISQHIRKLMQRNETYKSTGITVWNLRPQALVQEDLFSSQKSATEQGRIMDAVDTIRNRHGAGSIGILSTMPSTEYRTKRSKLIEATERYIHGLPLPYLGEVS